VANLGSQQLCLLAAKCHVLWLACPGGQVIAELGSSVTRQVLLLLLLQILLLLLLLSFLSGRFGMAAQSLLQGGLRSWTCLPCIASSAVD
jgi:hypothetical protein